jgi:hypothetical protein
MVTHSMKATWKATQRIGWSIQKVKELIKDLIKNKVIYEWSDDDRYHILAAKGVLNLRSNNRFSQLLEDLKIIIIQIKFVFWAMTSPTLSITLPLTVCSSFSL